jgi:hypothetical protein
MPSIMYLLQVVAVVELAMVSKVLVVAEQEGC